MERAGTLRVLKVVIMRVQHFALLTLFATMMGCGAPDVGDPPLLSESGASSSKDKKKKSPAPASKSDEEDRQSPYEKQPSPDGEDPAGDVEEEPAGPEVHSWRGAVPQTPTVRFGGDPYCNYDVRLTNIEVNLKLDGEGNVKQLVVYTTMTETTPSCQAAPYGARRNRYVFVPPTPTSSTTIVAVGDKNNAPTGNATLTITPGATGAPMPSRLVFQRTGGAAASLNWTVSTNVDLTETF